MVLALTGPPPKFNLGMITNNFEVTVIVLNLVMYPLYDYHLYVVVHARVNIRLFTAVGMQISTWCHCDTLEGVRGM
jgi:hypothetical protein